MLDQAQTSLDTGAGSIGPERAGDRQLMFETTPTDTARPAFKAVIVSILGLWVCYFVLTTVRSMFGLEFQAELLWRRAIVTLAGMGITFLMWLVLRLFDRRGLPLQVGAALFLAMPAAIMIAQVNHVVFADVQEKVESKIAERYGFSTRRDEAGNLIIEAPALAGADVDGPLGRDRSATASVVLPTAATKGDKWMRILEPATSRYFLLLAWSALYLALLAGARAQAAERREQRFRSAAKAAELRSLRYQVNPHFLFNTLNSLSAMVMTGKTEKAEEMIQTISSFYRHSLAEDPTTDTLLEDEFDLQRHYLAIEAVRFPDRLRPVFDLPVELADARVPGMILQPLVENSVKYAVAPVNRPITLRVAAREEYERLVIEVSDDGPGVPHGASNGFGIGLANVRDRLEARFGREATIVSGPTPAGYRTEIRIPLVRHG